MVSTLRRMPKLLRSSTARTRTSANVRVPPCDGMFDGFTVVTPIGCRRPAAGSLPNTTAAPQTGSAPVINGVQPAAHQNGLQANGEKAEFEELIHAKPPQTQPILTFEAGEPFLMKTGAMKPQHVAGRGLQGF